MDARLPGRWWLFAASKNGRNSAQFCPVCPRVKPGCTRLGSALAGTALVRKETAED